MASSFTLLSLVVAGFFFLLGVSNAQVRVSEAQFKAAVTSNGFPSPSSSIYNGFMASLPNAAITTNLEAAQYLAQMLHESAGLRKTREDGCPRASDCQNKYPASTEWVAECQGSNRPAGVGYFGRGYIQLTWCSNYIAASRALGLGEQLKKNPESVATDPKLSWAVSAWYWKERVHNQLPNGNTQFGLTTRKINGQSEECQGRNLEKSKQRFRYYVKVFQNFKVSGQPNEAGCY